MAASTAPAVKAKLLEILSVRPGLTGVVISWAAPTNEGDLEAEHIWLGTVEQEEDFAQVGGSPAKREEDYTIDLTVYVYQEGDDPQATEERAWAIRAQVSDAVRNNVLLDNVINFKAELETTRMEAGIRDKGWAARAIVQVHIVTRI